jgi:hypothetical protein
LKTYRPVALLRHGDPRIDKLGRIGPVDAFLDVCVAVVVQVGSAVAGSAHTGNSRIEPELPEGVRREDCELIGVEVVEILDFDRPNLWVRRLEYPKYKIHTDDTPVTLLTPGEGPGSRQARFWIYRSSQVGACYDAFAFTDDRTRAGPDQFLQDFQRFSGPSLFSDLLGDSASGLLSPRCRSGGGLVDVKLNVATDD